jgi:ribose transport system substrate-binding protein
MRSDGVVVVQRRSKAARRAITMGLLSSFVLAAVAGCGGSSSDSGSTSSSSSASSGGSKTSAAVLAEAKASTEKGYKGDFQLPPTDGPKAQPGKNVWYISCGQAYTACAQQSTGFGEAGKALGWKVNLTDGKADPTAASRIIRQAIAAKADGIVITAFDCPGIKSALRQAKAANIPTVTAFSLDCDEPAFGGGPPLFTASAKLYGSSKQGDFYAKWSAARANWIINDSKGTGEALNIEEQSQLLHKISNKGFEDQMAKCAGCKVTPLKFTFSQVPNPATQLWTSGIQSHPKAKYLAEDIDSLMDLGLRKALGQSGRRDLKVAGGEGFPTNLQLIRDGVLTVALALPQGWVGWAEADTINRLFAGADPASLPNEGLGWQIIDKDHNLPPAGKAFVPPIDYASAYQKVWGTSGT